ncbi:MAG: ATP-binding protein [Thermoleophilaceae bacterium]
MLALGWAVALALLLRTRELGRRLELVARAEHELRGPLGALGLVGAAAARDPANARFAAALESQLDRARGGLADLSAARNGARAVAKPEVVELEHVAAAAAGGAGPVRIDWRAGPVAVRADRRRLAQAFGNLLQNAAEHGGGDVSLRAHRRGDRVLVEIADRGRGLSIATAAVEEAGGRLRLIRGGRETKAAVELPIEEP